MSTVGIPTAAGRSLSLDLLPALVSLALGPVLFVAITLFTHLWSETLRCHNHIILII